MSVNAKNLIIGLDGVPFEVIHTYTQDGSMPFLNTIINNGIFKSMTSSLPPVSSTAWTSFFTGKNPAEHNIFGFYDLDTNFNVKFNLFDSNKAETVWEKLGKQGKSTLALNIPNTYPAKAINGVMISGFVAVELAKAVYPQELYPHLLNKKYVLDVDYSNASVEKDKFLYELNTSIDIRLEVFLELLRKKEWHLAITVFTETDRLNHFFMDTFYDEQNSYNKHFRKFYSKIDFCIKEMFSYFQDKVDNILIISDHGFEKLETEFYLNFFLEKIGLLKFKSSVKTFEQISGETICYACDPGRIYFNKKNYLSDTEKKKVISNIKYELEQLRWQGRPVVKNIFDKAEIFHGPYIDSAPDLLVLTYSGIDIKGIPNKNNLFGTNIFKGMHTFDKAIFIANNKNINVDSNLSIQTVLSTLY